MSATTTTTTSVTDQQRAVVLTSHPLQRIGAFALLELAEVDDLDELTPAAFDQAAERMTSALRLTASVPTAKDAGGFWLGVSYALWPNSAMNTTNRKSLAAAEIRERVEDWRRIPAETQWPNVPCALCGRPACDYFGKKDVPLAASTAYRNTTPPGQQGLALCFACMTCLYALPYGCAFGGGKVLAMHSWDDRLLRRLVGRQIDAVRQRTPLPFGAKPATHAFAEETLALRVLRTHDRRLSAGVELIVFSNSNKEQTHESFALDQPFAEWLRGTSRDRALRAGWRDLRRAHQSPKVPGSAMVARRAFRTPAQLLTRTATYLKDHCGDKAGDDPVIPHEALTLATLCRSFAVEVLGINNKDVEQLQALAQRVAKALKDEVAKGKLSSFVVANRKSSDLRVWLKQTGVRWAGSSQTQGEGALVTTGQWRLLFDPDEAGWLHRDLLFVGVLENLARLGWKTDDPDERAELDDTVMKEDEDEQ